MARASGPRMRRSVPLILVGVLVAGCFSADEAPDAVTAMDLLAEAERVAHASGADKVLVAVQGGETAAFGNQTPPPDVRVDDQVGDGRAPSWRYVYASDAGHHHIVVAASGQVLLEMELPPEALVHGGDPVTGWQVDSDEAVGVAVAADADFAAVLAAPDANLFHLLGQEGENATWVLFAEAVDRFAVVAVDASSGTFLGTAPLPPGVGYFGANISHEQDRFAGTVNLAQPNAEHTFALESAHPYLNITANLDGQSAGSTVDVTITGPEGQQESLVLAGPPSAPTSDRVTFTDVRAGTWRVALTLQGGVTQDYNVRWCADSTQTFTHPFTGRSQTPCMEIDPMAR